MEFFTAAAVFGLFLSDPRFSVFVSGIVITSVPHLTPYRRSIPRLAEHSDTFCSSSAVL